MVGGVVVLGWLCLMIGLGLIGPAVASFGQGFGAMFGSLTHLTSSAQPSASGPVTEAPVIDPLDSASTNVASVDLTVRVPQSVVGLQGYSCRLYVTLPSAAPVIVTETPVGGTSTLVLSAVALTKGANTFTASVVGPGGEGPSSAPVTVTLDVSKPKVTITAPKNNASVTGGSVTVSGRTQPASTIQVKDDANGATANATADDAGAFSTSIAIAAGPNNLTVTVTDPAGNGNSATVTVVKGTGVLHATLSSSVYQFTAAKLPVTVTFTAKVVGADGKPVAGASALFTVSVPGLPVVVSTPVQTTASGAATFSTSVPKGAMAGQGVADVLFTLANGQTTTARAALTVR
jgi:hypothetical protein